MFAIETRSGERVYRELMSDILLERGLPPVRVFYRNTPIVWFNFANKALIQSARIDLHSIRDRAPFTLPEVLNEYLIHGETETPNELLCAVMQLDSCDLFSRLVKIVYRADTTTDVTALPELFRQVHIITKKETAFDLHLKACAHYLYNGHYYLEEMSLLSNLHRLKENPIQEYWMRVVADVTSHWKHKLIPTLE